MKATRNIVLLGALNKLREKNLFRRKMKNFTANFCTVDAKTRLLLVFRICIAIAPKSEHSSSTPLLDDQLRADVI